MHVVFVHGLGGHVRDSWRASSPDKDLWPLWLQSDVGGVAVWSLGYEDKATLWQGWAMHLVDRGENVLARMLAEPALKMGDVIFIGHSLGGLVVKQLLRSADRKAMNDPDAGDLLRRVRRVAFLGTPHHGVPLASIGAVFRVLSRPSPATSAIVSNDPNLRDLNLWYREYSRTHSIENLVLAETRAYGPLGIIVQPDSADPGLPESPIPIDADHVGISKPKDRDAEVYIHVRDFIAKPIVGMHRDTIIAEKIEALTSAVVVADDRTSASLTALKQAVLDQTMAVQNMQGTARSTAPIIDAEAEKRLGKILQSRLFGGYDLRSDTESLADDLLTGGLTGASDLAKADALAWCARLLSSVDNAKAATALEKARSMAATERITIAEAFVTSAKGDTASALDSLATLNSPDARSAGFIIVCNHDGGPAAISWLDQAEIAVTDLESDGKFFLLQRHIAAEHWDESLAIAQGLNEDDFERTPALLNLAAAAHLVQAVPEELRTFVLQHAPFEAQEFPLAADGTSLLHRREAQRLYARASNVADDLGLAFPASISADRALWLSLRDKDSFQSAREELAASMRDPVTSLRRFPLALNFGLKLDLQAVEREINRQSALSGDKSLDAAVARFALAFTQENPREMAAYIDRHRKQLTAHLDAKIIAFIEIEMLSKSGQVQLAETRLAEAIAAGISAGEESHLRRMLSEATGVDPAEERQAQFERTNLLTDLRNLAVFLEDQEAWPKLAPFAKQLFERTHDLELLPVLRTPS